MQYFFNTGFPSRRFFCASEIIKKLLLGLVFCCLAAYVVAETDSNKKLRIGLILDPNFGRISSNEQNVESDGSKMGFAYGLTGDYYFAKNYAFSSGLSLITINGQFVQRDTVTVLHNQYLQIPLMLRLRAELSSFGVFANFGFTTDFRLSSSKDVNSPVAANNVSNRNASGDISVFRAGLLIGGGLEYNITDDFTLFGGLIYNKGLTTIYKNDFNLKNNYLALRLGVFF